MRRYSIAARKKPRQTRSRATVGVILEAATRVLARESLAGFNTNRIAEVAGISVGSLYQYFPNKDALLAELIEHAQRRLADDIESIVADSAGRPLEVRLEALVRFAVEQQYRNARIAAALDLEERRLPVQHRIAPHQKRMLSAIAQLISAHQDSLSPDLPPEAPLDCFLITRSLVESEIGRDMPVSSKIEARVLRALLGYLRPLRTNAAAQRRRERERRRRPSAPPPPRRRSV
jgi:AcrR family transcriptional regulator